MNKASEKYCLKCGEQVCSSMKDQICCACRQMGYIDLCSGCWVIHAHKYSEYNQECKTGVNEESRMIFEEAKKNGFIPEIGNEAFHYDVRDFAKRVKREIRQAYQKSKSDFIKDRLIHSLRLLDQIILYNET